MDFLCSTHFVFACSSIQTKFCALLLVLMTHAIEDLPANPEAAQTFPIPIGTADNGLSENDQWESESPGPLSSEKTEEKFVTMIKKVEKISLFFIV